ncbi:Threonine-phosphate decarboxylase [bioreactor metagenome]|uniref:threonine-phosphate decarboxylase n=1 Tax=bioreactor metagenome TaxID=1076179 RepID=A0A644T0P4_9ZZZZ
MDYINRKVIPITGLNAFEHGGNIYTAARNGGCLTNLIDFSANINPLGIPDSVRQSILANLDSIMTYPDAEAHGLKSAISQHYSINQNMITPGNGAVELLYVLCNALRPKQALIPAPTFSEYERSAQASGCKIQYVYLNPKTGFKIDIDHLITLVEDKSIDIVFIGNPNNPTGTLLERQELESLIQAAEKSNTLVVVDESFLDFLIDDSQYTCRPLLVRYQNLVILHSLTKFYAIPGLRLGFALASKQLTDKLHKGKDPWNVNSLAQCAGIAALYDRYFQQTSREFINQTNAQFYTQLKTIPKIKPHKPSVNFILLDISNTKINSLELRLLLANQDILIRDCSNYPGLSDNYIRLAVKLPQQNAVLIKTLQNICR